MRKHNDLIKNGRVSIWIGDAGSEDELLAYVDDGGFASDFDFDLNPNAGRELAVETIEAPVRTLVEGFSYWKNFVDECVSAGSERNIYKCKSMVVVYNIDYEPSEKVNENSKLQFLGSFDY